MKKNILSLVVLIYGTHSFAQQKINADDAAKHESDSVIVCTKIFGARYFEGAENAPTLLNAGAKYPDAPLTVVIYRDSRPSFTNKPEEFYVDKNVCVTGRIVLYKGKPQIILTKQSNIVVQ